jgi:hypothetical protein
MWVLTACVNVVNETMGTYHMQSNGLCTFRKVTILKGVYFSFLPYLLIPLWLFIDAVNNLDEVPITLTKVFSWVSPVPPSECWDSTKTGHSCFLPHPFQFIIN